MAFKNAIIDEPVPDMVSTDGPWAMVARETFPGLVTNFEVANRTIFHPIYIPAKLTVRRFWWGNGTTITGGATIHMGLYTSANFKPVRRLNATASAVQAGAAELQFVTPASPFVVTPDLYFIAISATSATNTQMRVNAMGNTFLLAYKMEQDAVNCPATVTAVASGNANYYMCGFSTTLTP